MRIFPESDIYLFLPPALNPKSYGRVLESEIRIDITNISLRSCSLFSS